MTQNKQQEIQNTIDNPITKNMKPGQEALKFAISKSGTNKINRDQISTGLDKWENKLAEKRNQKPKN